MRNVVITAGCRTPIGTMGGQFKDITSLDLSIPVMQQLIKRAGIHPETIDDVIWGCNYQRTYKENNLARVAALKAGFPAACRELPYIGTALLLCPLFSWAFTRLKLARQTASWLEALTA